MENSNTKMSCEMTIFEMEVDEMVSMPILETAVLLHRI